MATSLGRRTVDPSDVRPFQVDWTAELSPASDTISTSTWSVTPSGLTLATDSILSGNLITQIWTSTGTAGTTYEVTNRVVSAGGRTLERSFELVCIDL